MKKKVYLVSISGRLHQGTGLDGHTSMICHLVFLDKKDAEAHIPEFKRRCTSPLSGKDMNYIDPSTATLKIVELELIGVRNS